MLREVGLVLFLASVGIKAGENFVQMVVEGDGFLDRAYGDRPAGRTDSVADKADGTGA